MAEVAAGAGIALAAEEVVSTTVQAGVAGYFLTKPTLPLKATYTRIAVADDEDMKRRSLTRSHHTLTVINNKAYIFGGTTENGDVATNDMHVINLAGEKDDSPDYQLIPALPKHEGGQVPLARTQHAASAFNNCVAIYGGLDKHGQPINDNSSSIWLFNPEEKAWSMLTPKPPTSPPGRLHGAKLFSHEKALILFSNCSTHGLNNTADPQLWKFDTEELNWETMPPPPAPTSPTNAALSNGHLYLISSNDTISSNLHILPLNQEDTQWTTHTFPTNPLIPGPRSRHGGALLPLTTGYGRNYLIYLLGARENATSPPNPAPEAKEQKPPTQWSDTWALQLPSSNLYPQPKLSLKEALKPAKIKDAIRDSVGAESGKWSWAEVEVQVPEDPDVSGAGEGKLHPGPRASFGADVMSDGGSVVFWGGEHAEGGREGDGWVVRVE